jgi:hypothetical protein
MPIMITIYKKLNEQKYQTKYINQIRRVE